VVVAPSGGERPGGSFLAWTGGRISNDPDEVTATSVGALRSARFGAPKAAPAPPRPRRRPRHRAGGSDRRTTTTRRADDPSVGPTHGPHPNGETRSFLAHPVRQQAPGYPGAVVEAGSGRRQSQGGGPNDDPAAPQRRGPLHLRHLRGRPPPTERDRRRDWRGPGGSCPGRARPPDWAIASLDDVRKGFEDVPYPDSRIHSWQGASRTPTGRGGPTRSRSSGGTTDGYHLDRNGSNTSTVLASGGVPPHRGRRWWQGPVKRSAPNPGENRGALLLLRMDEGRVSHQTTDRLEHSQGRPVTLGQHEPGVGALVRGGAVEGEVELAG